MLDGEVAVISQRGDEPARKRGQVLVPYGQLDSGATACEDEREGDQYESRREENHPESARFPDDVTVFFDEYAC
jgi:hypothetical protein